MGIAYVHSVANDHKQDIGTIYEIEKVQAEGVAQLLVNRDKKYSCQTLNNGAVIITPNPNYEITESVIATNNNVQQSNINTSQTNRRSIAQGRNMNIFAGTTAAFAIASVVVAYLQYDKPSEKLLPEIQRIESVLRTQSQTLENLQQTQRNVDSHLQRIADSLGKK